MIPPIIRITSNTPRLRQHVSRSPVARRLANALSTKGVQIRRAQARLRITLRVCKTSASCATSSKCHAYSLQNERYVPRLPPKSRFERFVRDFLQKSPVKSPKRAFRTFLKNSHVKVCKTSVSHETSSKSQVGAHTSRGPAKQFRDSSPSKQHPLTRQSQCHSNIHLDHNSQPHGSLRLPRIFPRPHV